MANRLSILTFEDNMNPSQIRDEFPNENSFSASSLPCFAHNVNYLAAGEISREWSVQDKKKFMVEVCNFYWDDHCLFKYCLDQILRHCIFDKEIPSVINFCCAQACGGHFSMKKIATKILQCGYWLPCLKTLMHIIDLLRSAKSLVLCPDVI